MSDEAGSVTDWECFIESVPWLLQAHPIVEVGEPEHAVADDIDPDRFPWLRRLVAAATSTPVIIGDERRELLTWVRPGDGERLSWLTIPRGGDAPPVCADHADLLVGFGGIVERSSNEPSTWLVNCNDALTAREAAHDASFLEDFAWMVEDDGLHWPIELTDHYSICREANGNTTLCHRGTGDVLMFAADHAFDHIEVLDGCPPYSLYRITAAPTFTTWVEEVARQWTEACGLPDPSSP